MAEERSGRGQGPCLNQSWPWRALPPGPVSSVFVWMASWCVGADRVSFPKSNCGWLVGVSEPTELVFPKSNFGWLVGVSEPTELVSQSQIL